MDNNKTTKPLAPHPIPRIPVQSSTLASVGYDPETSTLAVQFRDRHGNPVEGAVYEYEGVPRWVYDDLVDPDFNSSRGRFFDRVVKKGGFNYRKVEDN